MVRGIKGVLVPFVGLPASLSAALNSTAVSDSEYTIVSLPRCAIIVLPCPVLCFSELLQDLENCENDPVAIADCFVSKVSLQHQLQSAVGEIRFISF